MASFSFGAGNAGKLLRTPLFLLGRVAGLAIPRTPDRWVFGSAVGLADGAWALWEYAAAQGANAVWLTGTAAEAEDARRRGIPSTPKSSWRGFWLTARAAVIVITHGFGDVNRYGATGGVIVQLWHGIPLKRIGLDAAVTTASPVPFLRRPVERLLAELYRRTQGRIRVLPAASHLVRGRLESAFGLPGERIPITGDPRTDVLFRGTPPERRAWARDRLAALVPPLAPDTRVLLYAPTWRDGAPDPAPPSAGEIAQLHALLEETDAVLLLRSHHLGAGDYAGMRGGRVRMLGGDLAPDATPLLPGIDVLITDYSSMAYDAAAVPMPMVFFAPDLAEYEASRGFYGTYDAVSGGGAASDWTELLAQLRAVLTDPADRARRVEHARRLSATVHEHADGESTARVYRVIASHLASDRSTERTS